MQTAVCVLSAAAGRSISNACRDAHTCSVYVKLLIRGVVKYVWLLVVEVPRQLTLFLGLPKIMHLIKPLGLINPNTASRVQGEQC